MVGFLQASLVLGALSCVSMASSPVQKRAGSYPVNIGVLGLPGIDLVDMYGPMEALYIAAGNYHLNVKIITPTAAPIVLGPPAGNVHNSTWAPHIIGQATFDDDLDDLEVLIVGGGAAARDPSLTYVDDYIVKMFPQLTHLITICTGAIFAARGGVLDGHRATTNKNAWKLVTQHGKNVTWVAPARWIVDGKVWSSSGVFAGVDLMFEYVRQYFGQEFADRISLLAEHTPLPCNDDVFTDIAGVPHQGQLNPPVSGRC